MFRKKKKKQTISNKVIFSLTNFTFCVFILLKENFRSVPKLDQKLERPTSQPLPREIYVLMTYQLFEIPACTKPFLAPAVNKMINCKRESSNPKQLFQVSGRSDGLESRKRRKISVTRFSTINFLIDWFCSGPPWKS